MPIAVRALTKRIESIAKIGQITRAMKLVAASRLRRASERATRARVYGEHIRAMAQNLAPYATAHPLFEERETAQNIFLVLITADRGLCGSFNQNAVRRADGIIKRISAQGQKVHLILVGSKGYDYFKKRRKLADQPVVGAYGKEITPIAVKLAERLMADYINGVCDEVIIVSNKFVSLATQKVSVEKLLPARPPEGAAIYGVEPIFEPSPSALFSALVPRAITVRVQTALFESEAAEHAARMNAMENATRNSEDLIGHLTLVRNKLRQASITSELVEIALSAEALKE